MDNALLVALGALQSSGQPAATRSQGREMILAYTPEVEEVSQFDVASLSQQDEVEQAHVALTAFDVANVGTVQTRPLGQVLLRPAALEAQFPQSETQALQLFPFFP